VSRTLHKLLVFVIELHGECLKGVWHVVGAITGRVKRGAKLLGVLHAQIAKLANHDGLDSEDLSKVHVLLRLQLVKNGVHHGMRLCPNWKKHQHLVDKLGEVEVLLTGRVKEVLMLRDALPRLGKVEAEATRICDGRTCHACPARTAAASGRELATAVALLCGARRRRVAALVVCHGGAAGGGT